MAHRFATGNRVANLARIAVGTGYRCTERLVGAWRVRDPSLVAAYLDCAVCWSQTISRETNAGANKNWDHKRQ